MLPKFADSDNPISGWQPIQTRIAIGSNFPTLPDPSGPIRDHRHHVFSGQAHGNRGAFLSACEQCRAVCIPSMPMELSASNDRRRAEPDINRGDFGFDQNRDQ